MKLQRLFTLTSGRITPESVAGLTGIRRNIQSGQKVLINGASGGIGSGSTTCQVLWGGSGRSVQYHEFRIGEKFGRYPFGPTIIIKMK